MKNRINVVKEKSGITLIALVITIIVLLILAGIIVAQLSGNGLFDKSKIAKEKYTNSQKQEESEIAMLTNEIDKQLEGMRQDKPIFKVLFDSVANTNYHDYSLKDNENIEDYDFIEVYARSYDPSGGKICFKNSCKIYVPDIDYVNDSPYCYRIQYYQNSNTNFEVPFKFKNNNTFTTQVLSSNYAINPQIYLVIGYKF